MPTNRTFPTRSQAAAYAKKQNWSSFRTTETDDGGWKASYEPGESPAKEWAADQDFVAWVETAWEDKVKKGVVIVTITPAELDALGIEIPYDVEPITPELFDKPTHRAKIGKGRPVRAGNREHSTVGSPTKLVWEIADKVAKTMGVKNPDLRKAIIEQATAQGVHPSTAATQYAKWRKKRLATD